MTNAARGSDGPDARPRGSRARRVAHRFLAVMLGIAVAILLGEIGLRLVGYDRTYYNPLASFHQWDPDSGHIGKPGFAGRFVRSEFDVWTVHDERGFRKQEHQDTDAPHAVFVFGDSYTWGWGVGQGKVFTDRLSVLRPDLNVENFGMNACGTVHQLVLFRKHAASRVRPGDTVLVAFFTNDFGDNLGGTLRVRVEGEEVTVLGPAERRGTLKSFLKDHSYFFNLAVYSWDRVHHAWTAREWQARARELDDKSPEMIATRYFLRAFRDEAEARGARFVVALIPGQGIPEANAAYRRAFFRCAESLSLETIDLRPGLEAAEAKGDAVYFELDRHWTERGHEVVAETLARALRPAGGD